MGPKLLTNELFGNGSGMHCQDIGCGKQFTGQSAQILHQPDVKKQNLEIPLACSGLKRKPGTRGLLDTIYNARFFQEIQRPLELACVNGIVDRRILELAADHFRGSGTVLVMDDEDVMRETIRDMLASLGYTAVCKENGKNAIDFFSAETKADRKITAMIFDLTVPGGMGGKAAVYEIRKVNMDIPVFVASGYAEDPIMKNPVEYGFTASICKPFRKAELAEMLGKYLKNVR
jgi:CheY-like chemotaxis protein